jgi:hypothetical protein
VGVHALVFRAQIQMPEQRDAESAAVQEIRTAVLGLQKRAGREIDARIEVIEVIADLAEQFQRTER